jgi:hypothetical protein
MEDLEYTQKSFGSESSTTAKSFETNIKKSKEAGFNLATCFLEENKEPNSTGYEKQDDYYFDSYSHFNIHE